MIVIVYQFIRVSLRLLNRLTSLKRYLFYDDQKRFEEAAAANRVAQIALQLRYRDMARAHLPLPAFDDVAFRSFSQNSEDGLLLYIFGLIGATNRTAVEICAGNGIECNSANLIINHGWRGLLIDGDAEKIRFGREFYARRKETTLAPPRLLHAWVTRENVNQLVLAQGFKGEIDLFSLDLDGVDYWVWQALTCIQPRVVVIEFNSFWGADQVLTVPYRIDFSFASGLEHYRGASLAAFVKLARTKGYRLVGCERLGFNAFFVRDGLGDTLLPELALHDYYRSLTVTAEVHAMRERLARYEWVKV